MVLNAQEQVERFIDFVNGVSKKKLSDAIREGKKSLLVNFADLVSYDMELGDQLLEDPEETIKAFEIALENFELPSKMKVRFINLPKSQEVLIRDIRSKDLNKFLSIEGIVRQSSDVRPQVTSAKFECPACANTITILQLDTKFREPSLCGSCGRRGRFRLISKELVDAQRLIIEESPESLVGGEQPKRVSVFLEEDLVEPRMEKKTTPGAKVRVMGIVKEVPVILKSGAASIRYDLMIKTNYIEPMEEMYEEIELNQEDEEAIKELSRDPKLFEKLVGSISPTIYGHEHIKEALLLQLMSGVKKEKEDRTFTRGDLHVLLVGDPGSGKSVMLSGISKIAPKGRFVSGKGATSAGITATVVRDEFLRGWALEAGAIVLANGGVAIIDELDKMSPEDRDALHEGMEQQRVTINKANIQAVLKAETTILAAANPKLGRFDPYKPIANQIDLPPTLINRFDLIFPVRDLPNKEMDELIASHVLKLHQKPKSISPMVPLDLLKKYVAYARQKVKPVLSDAALDEIKQFYLNLRLQGTGEGEIRAIPISARQLEALVRLSEASAKTRLSNKVMRMDAKRAINLLRYCLMQVGFDYETGQIDIDRISTGITASHRGKIITVREIIDNLEKKSKTISLDELSVEAMNKGIRKEEIEEIIESLKKGGEIFEPKRNWISKIG